MLTSDNQHISMRHHTGVFTWGLETDDTYSIRGDNRVGRIRRKGKTRGLFYEQFKY